MKPGSLEQSLTAMAQKACVEIPGLNHSGEPYPLDVRLSVELLHAAGVPELLAEVEALRANQETFGGLDQTNAELGEALVEARRENERLREAIGSLLWVLNNVDNALAAPEQFDEFRKAAEKDARAALSVAPDEEERETS